MGGTCVGGTCVVGTGVGGTCVGRRVAVGLRVLVGRGVFVILVLVGCGVGVETIFRVLDGRGDVGVTTMPDVLVGKGGIVGNAMISSGR